MENQLRYKTEESIKKILDEGITTNNLDHLYKLSKINHIAKEDEAMNYGRYDQLLKLNDYDRYNTYNYGARGYDMKYRGQDHINRMSDDYRRYMDSRERYGANEETDKSFHYMVKALEDFINVLHEEADTPKQKQMLTETLQRSMR